LMGTACRPLPIPPLLSTDYVGCGHYPALVALLLNSCKKNKKIRGIDGHDPSLRGQNSILSPTERDCLPSSKLRHCFASWNWWARFALPILPLLTTVSWPLGLRALADIKKIRGMILVYLWSFVLSWYCVSSCYSCMRVSSLSQP